MELDPTVISYIPASLCCTSKIVNDCLPQQKMYLLDLLCSSISMELKYHRTADGYTGGIAVILTEMSMELFLVTPSVNSPLVGIIEGESSTGKVRQVISGHLRDIHYIYILYIYYIRSP